MPNFDAFDFRIQALPTMFLAILVAELVAGFAKEFGA